MRDLRIRYSESQYLTHWLVGDMVSLGLEKNPKNLAIYGKLRKLTEVYGSLRKPTEAYGKLKNPLRN